MNWKKQREKRNREIVRYRNKGLSYAKIGKLFGVSYECVRKVINTYNKKRLDN